MTVKGMILTTPDKLIALSDTSYRLRHVLIYSQFAKQNFATSRMMIYDIFGCAADLQLKEEHWPISGNRWGHLDPLFWEMFELADIISAD